MAGLWEGVPASPCSAVSDDPSMGSYRELESFQTKKKHAVARSFTLESARRSRRTMRSASPPLPPSSVEIPVGFVNAAQQNHGDSDLVTKLNFSAADERRKMLLQRLRAIDAKKAQLAEARRNSSRSPSPSIAVSQDSCVISASTSTDSLVRAMNVIDVDSFDSNKKLVRRSSRRAATLSNVSSPSMTDLTSAACLKSPNLELDISSVRAGEDVSRVSLEKFADTLRSPSPTLTTAGTSTTPSASPMVECTPSTVSADVSTRKRSSRRITRPRTPSVLLQGFPGERTNLPSGISRCKRLQFAKKIISVLMKNSTANPFSAPVNELWPAESIPRYFDVIRKPMDLRTVKRNLDGTDYLNLKERSVLNMFDAESFAEDVRLVFRNAMVYNNVGDMLYNCAQELMSEFEDMWKNLPESPSSRSKGASKKRAPAVARKTVPVGKRSRVVESASARVEQASCPPRKKQLRRRAAAATVSKSCGKASTRKVKGKGTPKTSPGATERPLTSTKQVKSRLDYLNKCRAALLARAPLPKGSTFTEKAALIYDVPMTFAEKNHLSDGIRKLPSAKLDVLVNIYREAMGEKADGANDEIELDINQLNNKTLRNIEAYLETCISGFQTLRSSEVGAEFSCVKDIEDEIRPLELRLRRAKTSPDYHAKITGKPRSFFDRSSDRLYLSSSESSSEEGSSSSDDSSASDSDSD